MNCLIDSINSAVSVQPLKTNSGPLEPLAIPQKGKYADSFAS